MEARLCAVGSIFSRVQMLAHKGCCSQCTQLQLSQSGL